MLLTNFSGFPLEAGVDEAGRGALAGPVVAAAVVLPPDYQNPAIKDSKLLKSDDRKRLSDEIKNHALAWGLGILSNNYIDEYNILQSAIQAMIIAIEKLYPQPQFVIVDGNRFHTCKIPFQTIVKGDRKYQSIAAASILAKHHRDELMLECHKQYPIYEWDKNKGYPTIAHRMNIQAHGHCPLHRRSFNFKTVPDKS